MLKNQITIAFRNIIRYKGYSFINVTGLAVASAVFLLIMAYVRFEHSYEDFHKKADDIYRVTLDLYSGSEFIVTDCETYPAAGPALKKQMPEIVDFVRLWNMDAGELKAGDKSLIAERIYATDPSAFSVFDYDFIGGNKSVALKEPMQAVITESMARKIFNSTDIIGKTVKLNNKPLIISGVVRNVPENSHLKFDFLVSFSSQPAFGKDTATWNSNNNYTYLQLLPATDLTAFNKKLKKFSEERLKNEIMVAEPIKSIHLYSKKTFEPEINGDIKTVRFLLIVAFLILLTGSVNYINLTTARTSARAKETGMRKLLGSSKFSLFTHYFIESIIINLLAVLVSVIIIKLSLHAYLQLIDKPADTPILWSWYFWSVTGGLFILNCLLSGIYPALVLSSIKPATVVKKSFTSSAKSISVRKILVVGQFAVAIVVLVSTITIYRQVRYMRNHDLGMNTDQVLVVHAPLSSANDSMRHHNNRVFKNELLKLPGVEKLSVSGSVPGVDFHQINSSSGVTQYGSQVNKGYNFYHYSIDEHFLPAMNIDIAAGRNFHPGKINKGEVIINEEAARILGFQSAEAAIGKKITLGIDNAPFSTVVGVLKNYHQRSLKEAQLPMIHWYSETNVEYYTLTLSGNQIHRTVGEANKIWREIFKENNFQYQFLDDLYDRQYKADIQFGKIIGLFGGLALLITCLGILGLTVYTIVKRTKEIGIRKVLGASVESIVQLLSLDFIKLVAIAGVVAVPIAWYVMNEWLQNFAYRTEIRWWVFLLAGLFAIFIALLTISFQAIKAALSNPVKSLRTE